MMNKINIKIFISEVYVLIDKIVEKELGKSNKLYLSLQPQINSGENSSDIKN